MGRRAFVAGAIATDVDREILARTMTERREKGGELAEIRTATGAQIASVGAARAALGQLREMLWKDEAGDPIEPAPLPEA